ncbi:GntR family transcriptional regulator [Leucobacter allii]|uniref:GntR family transcriptional regulator n=1 Tax=Leucobacter allii TaxID=2932247 RepID=UPI001FD1C3B1|nr:GntR family transcriptional regulator [Leucobacter allii]UOR01395.1 GntR family transcriptional regulator [Leucobacter allii]
MVEFAPVRPESTAALVARKLRELISGGVFRPGQQLIEVDLARSFGVSRGILREALQRLAQEGLLVSRPNRGVFVAEFGPDEVFDIYTARLAIERAACLKVIEVLGAGPELADALDALSDRLEAAVRGDASESAAVDLDIEFHECMVAAARSPRLDRMHATLAAESRMCQRALDGPVYPAPARIAEHRGIAAAIRSGDVPRLHVLLAAHMDRAVEAIVARLAEAREGAPGALAP